MHASLILVWVFWFWVLLFWDSCLVLGFFGGFNNNIPGVYLRDCC